MVCSWLKALQQEQAEAAEGMETGNQSPQLQKADRLTLRSVLREGHKYQPFASGLQIAHLNKLKYDSGHWKPGIHLSFLILTLRIKGGINQSPLIFF